MKQKTITVTFQLRVPTWMAVATASQFVREAINAAAATWLSRRSVQIVTLDGQPTISIHRDRVEVFAP